MDHNNLKNKELLSIEKDEFFHGVSIACLIIGFKNKSLQILLNKFDGYHKWMIPGGFVFQNESIDDAALRTLKMRTGLDNLYLRQFKAFGDCKRASKKELEGILRVLGVTYSSDHWIFQRLISIGYYAFVDMSQMKLPLLFGEAAQWFRLDNIPDLFGDDNRIINDAIVSIRQDIDAIPLDYELLPHKFTMPELQSLYEAILGRTFDRRNFERKMLAKGYIDQLDESNSKMGGRAIRLFSFNKAKYKEQEHRFYLPVSVTDRSYSI
ncbi:MAG: NUDIX domain-containing protein [Dysgonomonas sp.]